MERTKTKADQEGSFTERQSKSLDHGGGRQRAKEYFKNGVGGGQPGHTCRFTRRSSLCTSRTTVTAACQPQPRTAKQHPAAPDPAWRSIATERRRQRASSQMKRDLTHFPVTFRLITATSASETARSPQIKHDMIQCCRYAETTGQRASSNSHNMTHNN